MADLFSYFQKRGDIPPVHIIYNPPRQERQAPSRQAPSRQAPSRQENVFALLKIQSPTTTMLSDSKEAEGQRGGGTRGSTLTGSASIPGASPRPPDFYTSSYSAPECAIF